MARMNLKSFKPIPAGTYKLRINDCREQQSQKGDMFYSWELEVVDDSQTSGEKFNWGTPTDFGPNSKAYAFLRAAGLPEQEGDAEFDTDDFLGQELYAKVIIAKNTKGVDINKLETVWQVDEFEQQLSKFRKPTPSKPASVSKPVSTVPASKPAAPSSKPASRGVLSRPKPSTAPVQEEAAAAEGGGLTDFPE